MCTVLLPPGDNPIAVNKYISNRLVDCADVSDQHISSIFKVQAVQEDGTNKLSRNDCKELRTYVA